MRLLDCFQGLGGVSEGFLAEGFTVHGIEITPAIAKICFERLDAKFPGKVTVQVADIATLKGEDFRGYDVVWGSPPCRDFTILNDKCWKSPKDPQRGLILVNAFLDFVKDAKPKIWILENVSGLAKHLSMKPQAFGSMIKGGKRHVFYGNFSSFLIPQTSSKPLELINCPNRSWERARIPLACSRAFAVACRERLLEAQA